MNHAGITQGNWHVARRDSKEKRFLVTADGETVIADCSTGSIGSHSRKITVEEQEANANAVADIPAMLAKLSERKTVHEWLNKLAIPVKDEQGNELCLLRRIRIALDELYEHKRWI